MEPIEPTDVTPPPPDAPVQQQQQQPAGKPVALRDHQTLVVPMLNGMRIYTTAIDVDGALWERWSDTPPGTWNEVHGPTR